MVYLISLAVILLDQISKIFILDVMNPPQTIEVLPFANIVLAYNKGVSFSMMSNGSIYAPYILAIVALLICAGLVWWMMKEKDKWTRVGIALIIGGSIGNVIDRFLYGAVVDFVDLHAFGYHWPAFNVADSAICIGAFLILLRAFRLSKEKKNV